MHSNATAVAYSERLLTGVVRECEKSRFIIKSYKAIRSPSTPFGMETEKAKVINKATAEKSYAQRLFVRICCAIF